MLNGAMPPFRALVCSPKSRVVSGLARWLHVLVGARSACRWRGQLRGLWVPLSGLLGHRSRVALAPASTFGLCEHALCRAKATLLLSSEDI